MLPPNTKPIPRTALEPVCRLLPGIIRKHRVRAGLSLNQLAARTGLSRQMLSYVESEKRLPTIDTVARIGRALGKSGGALMAEAERRLASAPAACRRCNHSCMAGGRWVWWNPRRGCTRRGR